MSKAFQSNVFRALGRGVEIYRQVVAGTPAGLAYDFLNHHRNLRRIDGASDVAVDSPANSRLRPRPELRPPGEGAVLVNLRPQLAGQLDHNRKAALVAERIQPQAAPT